MTPSSPKFKIGDIIYWYCNKEQRTHQAQVEFVNYVHIGEFYDDISYEVKAESCGEVRTLFIDENDAMSIDF